MSEAKQATDQNVVSSREFMAILIARDLHDGDIGAWGAGGLIPMAAIRLAKFTHAPKLITGGERIYDSYTPDSITSRLEDSENVQGAKALEGFWELFGHWHHGVDFFCFSGLQIDPFGNLNLHEVRQGVDKPIRGGGVANISLAGSCARTYIYMTEHSTRRFVEHLDFRTLPGHLEGGESRKLAGLTGGGPVMCVTPLGVFDFPAPEHRMRLRSCHEGVSVADITARTGFDFVIDSDVKTTPPPSAEELGVLRERVDPDGKLRP